MKKFYFAGTALLAVAAMMPAMAFGAAKATFDANNVIVPASRWTPGEPWTAQAYVINTGERYEGAQNFDNPNYNHIWGVPSADAAGNEWYSEAYALTNGENVSWTEMESPFNTDKWIASDIMGDIYLRREFTLDAVPGGAIFLACGRDDAPSEWYINGVLVRSDEEGWNEDNVVLLTDEQKALLRPGKNLFAVHVHQNWGGAFADCGLYEANQQVDLLTRFDEGWWPTYYKLLPSNGDIEGAVESGCFNLNADESDWTVAVGPMGNNFYNERQTFWDSDRNAILVRRHFQMSEANVAALKSAGDVYVTISYDEWPVVYLNGHELCRYDEWNDGNYAIHQLTDEQKGYLVAGDNVLAVSLQQGGGGGHIDYGFYVNLPIPGFTAEEGTDVPFYKSLITRLIADKEKLPLTTSAIEAAVAASKEAVADANVKSADIRDLFYTLYNAINGVRGATATIQAYYDTQKFFTDEAAQAKFDAAVTTADFEDALKTLRYARRGAARETHADVFKGQTPANGKFYIYNVGRKQFLQGGSDWGAHASLGMPGLEVELISIGDAKVYDTECFVIRTGLSNGDDGTDDDDNPMYKEWLVYSGYMDGPYSDGAGGWAFIPVEGMEGVYHIAQADYENAYWEWDPFARTDGGRGDETNVCTESRKTDLTDPNNMWKLVTRAQRDALIAEASIDNPVDVSYYIVNPGFNQRETLDNWDFSTFEVWGRGGNWNDFICESYNSTTADINQMVEGLPAGIYKVACQGFYRNSTHAPGEEEGSLGVLNAPQVDNAYLYAGDDYDDDTALPYILSEANNCPGEGRTLTDENGNEFNIPGGAGQNAAVQATCFFKAGLYKVYTVVEKTTPADDTMVIGILKEEKGDAGDWIVVDNFRLTYYGTETTKEAVKDMLDGVESVIADEAREADNRIFNLQGIEVKNANVPGIYIQNGRKFIVK